jgi:hypothetical protein
VARTGSSTSPPRKAPSSRSSTRAPSTRTLPSWARSRSGRSGYGWMWSAAAPAGGTDAGRVARGGRRGHTGTGTGTDSTSGPPTLDNQRCQRRQRRTGRVGLVLGVAALDPDRGSPHSGVRHSV